MRAITGDLIKLVPVYIEDSLHEVQVSWSPPPDGTLKVNVDGSFRRSVGTGACGGLIRNSCGTLLKGFFCNLGACNSTWAELWGLYLGIKLVRCIMGPSQNLTVVFELDSEVVVNMVRMGTSQNLYYHPLLLEIRSLLAFPD